MSSPGLTDGPAVSVVIPVYQEGAAVLPCLARILREVSMPCEILVVHDIADDSTVPFVNQVATEDDRVRAVLNTYGRGPANAIRFGIAVAAAPVVVVTMADGSDDPRQIDELARLVDRGVVVAAASRYMPGGQQVGGPRLKRMMSRWAGRTLRWFARVGTRDATNSFKAYATQFVREVGIDSRTGFEIGLELTAKATRLRLPVAELPTIWLDRALGESRFDLARWLPGYLRWYFFCFGPRLNMAGLRRRRQRWQTVSGEATAGEATVSEATVSEATAGEEMAGEVPGPREESEAPADSLAQAQPGVSPAPGSPAPGSSALAQAQPAIAQTMSSDR